MEAADWDLARDCSYTDADGNYYSGDCATQEDIDDGWATYASAQAEVDDIQTEVDEEQSSYCSQQIIPTDDCSGSSSLVRGSQASSLSETAAPSDGSVVHGGPFAADAGLGCLGASIAYGVSLGATGLTFLGLSVVLTSEAPPVTAVVAACGAVVLAAASVAGAAISLGECLYGG